MSGESIDREIERIILERDFGGWTPETAAAAWRLRDEWEADMERRGRLIAEWMRARRSRRAYHGKIPG